MISLKEEALEEFMLENDIGCIHTALKRIISERYKQPVGRIKLIYHYDETTSIYDLSPTILYYD